MDVRIAFLVFGYDDLPIELVEMPRVGPHYARHPPLALDGKAAVDGADDLRGEPPDACALVVARDEDLAGVRLLEMGEFELLVLAIVVVSGVEDDVDAVTVRHDLESVSLAGGHCRAADDESRRRSRAAGDVGRQRQRKRPANGRLDVAEEFLDGFQYLLLGRLSLSFSRLRLRRLSPNARDEEFLDGPQHVR